MINPYHLLSKMVLEEAGFEVHAFTHSLSALKSFKPSFYDLIILDIKMPNMDGFELCKKIKELDSKVKVCFLTAKCIMKHSERKNIVWWIKHSFSENQLKMMI